VVRGHLHAANDDGGGESDEIMDAAQQFNAVRTAPGGCSCP
jgi:hypothetical protein